MNCQEVLEHISAAVDNRLSTETKRMFETHIQACAACRNLFEMERLTKRVIQQKLRFQTIPGAVSQRILSRISEIAEQETEPGISHRSSWVSKLLPQPRFRPAFAVGLIALVALILFVSMPFNAHHLHTSPDDNNVVHQSLNNFDAVVAGTLKPQMASDSPAEVRKFFVKKVDYKVRVPRMKDCTLMGGLVSNYQGKPLAHVVYKHDGEVIYLYQVDMQTVIDGKALTIPADAKEELLRTGWYVQSQHPKCSLVMWMVDNTLCTAVADIDKGELIAYLSYPDGKE